MADNPDRLKDLEALEALLADIERALANEGAISEEDKARLEELRQQCMLKRELLIRGGKDETDD
ncbi:MAG TPA: hypothetical protein VNO70_09550 [Blastocatellia bacterium]|nr:hypothetical protein [Blastocatellia bacterium]